MERRDREQGRVGKRVVNNQPGMITTKCSLDKTKAKVDTGISSEMKKQHVEQQTAFAEL